jgi:hypothetical protein
MDQPIPTLDLDEVKEEFSQWRNNRKQRVAIPEKLWDMAVMLCAQHTISKISTTLRLGYTKLKRKVEQVRKFSNKNAKEKSSFVEVNVPSHEIQRASDEQNQHTIEFFRVDGSRMRIVTGDCVLLNQCLFSGTGGFA